LVISGADAQLYGENKPAPDVYKYAMAKLGVKRPVAIEDAQMSVQAAVNAGIPCVAVPGGWCKDHDYSAAVARFEELPASASVENMACLVTTASTTITTPPFVEAIFFGATGTLANSSEMQFNAFNKALEEANLPKWDQAHYRKTLQSCNGGTNRLQAFLQQKGVQATIEQIVAVHARKTEIFAQTIKESGGLTARPGVLSLLKDAKAKGLKTALCSTAYKANVDLMFEGIEGLSRDMFDLVISRADAQLYGENKPAPDVYKYAMAKLGVKRPLAIEDAQMSVQAAVNAGIPCVAVPGGWCMDHDYSAADARVVELSDSASVEDMARLVTPTPPLVEAIFFGATGTLATSSEMQFNAFNEALKEANLPMWDEADYRTSLQACNGGTKRLKAFLKENDVHVTDEQIVAVHARKTEIFAQAIKESGGLNARPGVLSLLKDAKAKGLKTALCSTAHKANVDLMFEGIDGLSRDMFDLVISGADAQLYGENKPAPDVYKYAIAKLGVKRALAIEDAQMSVQAAVNAGICCVAVPGGWCKDHDYAAAVARLEELPPNASMEDMVDLAEGRKTNDQKVQNRNELESASTKTPPSDGEPSRQVTPL
jgi:HAD superfamily hydrolase (TIGR01509 family)